MEHCAAAPTLAAVAERGSRKTIYSPGYERIVALLRQTRTDAGLSQAELARRLERPRTFVTKCELGERRLDLLEWLEFCRACGVEPAVFLAQLKALEDKRP